MAGDARGDGCARALGLSRRAMAVRARVGVVSPARLAFLLFVASCAIARASRWLAQVVVQLLVHAAHRDVKYL